MKKKIILITFALFIVSALSAQSVSGKLTVWSFTDEVDNMIKKYFTPSHSGVQIEYSQKPSEQFQNWLDPVFYYEHGTPPDVIALESEFVKKYIESGLLLDLTDIYNANKNKLIAYPVEVASYEGRVYGLSWQVCPGAFFYRRSLAKKYLGTDDPAVVQKNFSNLDQFLKTAKLLKDKSGGKCVVVSSLHELVRPFLSMRTQPWIINGKLAIDPVMENCMDFIKNLHGNGLDGGVGQWSQGWFEGMRGELKDNSGKPLEVFGYFLPTWGLHYVLKTNAPKTSGDWAMIQGPVSYSWGGTWLAATAKTKNPAAAKELIRYLTTDNAFLENYAKESGDVVSNTEVINKIKNGYREPFLGGQNHYAAFADMAKNVNGKLVQGTDEIVNSLFNNALWPYVNGEKTKELTLSDFRSQAVASLANDALNRLGLVLNGVPVGAIYNKTPNNTTNTAGTTANTTSTTTNTANTAKTDSNNTITTNTSINIFKYLPSYYDMDIYTDRESGGKSTGDVSIDKENIDGIEYSVINLTITLIKNKTSWWGELRIDRNLPEKAKKALGIRFKVYGDGRPWFLCVETEEAMKDYAWFRYQFNTIKDKVSTIDIPYSILRQPQWGKKIIFNKNSIRGIIFSRNNNLAGPESISTGTSIIKIFDIEVY